jgi:hypothetical protein
VLRPALFVGPPSIWIDMIIGVFDWIPIVIEKWLVGGLTAGSSK